MNYELTLEQRVVVDVCFVHRFAVDEYLDGVPLRMCNYVASRLFVSGPRPSYPLGAYEVRNSSVADLL
jgi:hypothetical protein